MSLKIDSKIVHTAATELIMQNIESFATQSQGAIRVATENIMGDMEQSSMLAEIANLIGGRDIGSDGALTAKNLDSRDENNIKMYWSTGAIEFKYVDATRYGSNSESFSYAIGEQIGRGIMQYMLNSAIAATRASIETQSSMVTGDGTATVSHTLLNTGLKALGDARDSVVCWVMTGATYTDLVGASIANGSSDIAYGAIYTGTTGTLNKPTFVTDSDGLTMTAGVAVLGLTTEAIIVTETAARNFISETVSGNANLKHRIQGEGEFMLNVKGYSWKAASGINPSKATVGTKANWEKKASNLKATAGILINVK